MAETGETIQALISSLVHHREKPAIIAFREDGSKTWTYGDLFTTVSSVADGLAKIMRQEGKTIALYAGNSPEWIIAALAAMYAGGVLLPVDKQADEETLRHIFNNSRAGILFTDESLAGKIDRLDLDHPPRVFCIDCEENEQAWRSLFRDKPEPPSSVASADRAALFYTSGTTGPPKGVPLSHANLACQPEAIREARLIVPEDRVLLPLPLHHVYPFVIGLLTPLALGLPVIFPASLTGREIIRAIDEGRASIIIGVPRLYRTLYEGISGRVAERGKTAAGLFAAILALSRLLRRRFGILPGKYFFSSIHKQFGSSLRVLASGGSALDARLAENLEGMGWEVAIGYGLTETSPLLTINPPGSGKLRSVGRPVRGVEISIAAPANPSASSAGTGENTLDTGEVIARGPNVFTGYHQLEEKTQEAFTEDGWFRTGDLGHLDNEGYLYLHGRSKTLIVTESGKNVQPDEIEEAYTAHPAIAEIGVFLHGGGLSGIIVPDLKNIRQDGDIGDIIRNAVAEISGRLPPYKSLAGYAVTREALPRTRLGKLRRHLLEGRYDDARAGEEDEGKQAGPIPRAEMSDHDQALLEDRNTEKIWEWLARRYADRRLTPDSSPRFDLGIDSLEWLDVSLEVQQLTGVELGEEAIGRIETIRDLLEEVSSRSGTGEALDPVRPLQDPEAVLDEEQKRWLEPQGPVLSLLSFIAYHGNRMLLKSCFRLQVSGRENLSAGEQYLIAPNHLSALDPLVIAAALPYPVLRRTFFAGWIGIAFRNPIFRFVSRLAQAVPVDSRHAVSSSLAFGSAVLGRKNNLIWFPEGRRSADGSLQEFKPGISLLLEHHDVPVVPVAINGTYKALPAGKLWPRFRKITVSFGEPVDLATLREGKSGEAGREHICRTLRQRVADLQQAAGGRTASGP